MATPCDLITPTTGAATPQKGFEMAGVDWKRIAENNRLLDINEPDLAWPCIRLVDSEKYYGTQGLELHSIEKRLLVPGSRTITRIHN